MARKIEMKIVEIDEKSPVKYKELTEAILNQMPMNNGQPRGFTLQEVRKRGSVMKKLEEVGNKKVLILEEAEWASLKEAMNMFQWGAIGQVVEDYADHIENAEEAKLKE